LQQGFWMPSTPPSTLVALLELAISNSLVSPLYGVQRNFDSTGTALAAVWFAIQNCLTAYTVIKTQLTRISTDSGSPWSESDTRFTQALSKQLSDSIQLYTQACTHQNYIRTGLLRAISDDTANRRLPPTSTEPHPDTNIASEYEELLHIFAHVVLRLSHSAQRQGDFISANFLTLNLNENWETAIRLYTELNSALLSSLDGPALTSLANRAHVSVVVAPQTSPK
jgi:hypothetical protein